MRKITLLFIVIFSAGILNAQTEEGSFLLEVGFVPFAGDPFITAGDGQLPPSTGVQFWTSDGNVAFALGAEGGYFLMDDLALKLGLGFSSISPDEGDGVNSFSYKFGFKYYVSSIVPVQIDLTGSTIEDIEDDFFDFDTPDPLWLGIQAGYAIFLNDNVAFEPALRYNISLNDDFIDQGIFEARFGFSLFF